MKSHSQREPERTDSHLHRWLKRFLREGRNKHKKTTSKEREHRNTDTKAIHKVGEQRPEDTFPIPDHCVMLLLAKPKCPGSLARDSKQKRTNKHRRGQSRQLKTIEAVHKKRHEARHEHEPQQRRTADPRPKGAPPPNFIPRPRQEQQHNPNNRRGHRAPSQKARLLWDHQRTLNTKTQKRGQLTSEDQRPHQSPMQPSLSAEEPPHKAEQQRKDTHEVGKNLIELVHRSRTGLPE